jgi:hypothetical protein
MRTLEYVLKQQTRWERAYYRALRDLQALQKPRPPQPEPPALRSRRILTQTRSPLARLLDWPIGAS